MIFGQQFAAKTTCTYFLLLRMVIIVRNKQFLMLFSVWTMVFPDFHHHLPSEHKAQYSYLEQVANTKPQERLSFANNPDSPSQ